MNERLAELLKTLKKRWPRSAELVELDALVWGFMDLWTEDRRQLREAEAAFDPASGPFGRVVDSLGVVFDNYAGGAPRARAGYFSAALQLWRAGWRGDTSREHALGLLASNRRHQTADPPSMVPPDAFPLTLANVLALAGRQFLMHAGVERERGRQSLLVLSWSFQHLAEGLGGPPAMEPFEVCSLQRKGAERVGQVELGACPDEDCLLCHGSNNWSFRELLAPLLKVLRQRWGTT